MLTLTRGANAPLPTAPVRVQLTWRPGPCVPDLDLCALLLSRDGQVASDADFVFYNQARHPSGSVTHTGKTTTGAGACDELTVVLPLVPNTVDRVVVAGSADGGTFGQVPGLYVTLADETGTPLLTHAAVADTETALLAGELYRRDNGWKFRAISQGYRDGLAGLARDFGVHVDDPHPAAVPAAQPSTPPAPSSATSSPSVGIDWLNPPIPAGYDPATS